MPESQSFLDRAGEWFLRSGIQHPSGGVARYYRSDLGRNARISTEITGYAISALVWLHDRTGREEYLDRALQAARFLIRTAWDARLGTFPFEHSDNGDHAPALSYFFDCGIIARGLLAAWRVTKDAELLDAAVACGRGMIADFLSRASIHPILSLPGKDPLAYEPRWSASPGCYQLKSAMAWFDLFEATGDRDFEQAYESALVHALANERDFLPGETNREKVMDRLHAYSYFLEGLLPGTDRPECRRVFADGVARMAALAREIEPVFARSDVYAQLLRARLYGEACGALALDEAGAAYEAAEAAKFQFESDDFRVHGGFGFGTRAGQQLPFVNPVSTAFCAQALALWRDRASGGRSLQRQALI